MIWAKTNGSVLIIHFFFFFFLLFYKEVQLSPNQLSHSFPKFPNSATKKSVSFQLLSIHTLSQ